MLFFLTKVRCLRKLIVSVDKIQYSLTSNQFRNYISNEYVLKIVKGYFFKEIDE